MYMTEAPNHVYALDARHGRVVLGLRYIGRRKDARVCCGSVNRGVAILGDTLFMGTIDAHAARDRCEDAAQCCVEHRGGGSEAGLLDHARAAGRQGQSASSAWPAASTEFADSSRPTTRKTGKEAWRFYTVPGRASRATKPGPAIPGSTAALRLADRLLRSGLESDVLGHRQSGPGLERRRSRAATTCTAIASVALDADTGKLKWYFQFTPHDEFDYDAVQIPVLADVNWKGTPRKLMLWANRNGFFYVLDRTNGKFLSGTYVREGELGDGPGRSRPADARAQRESDRAGSAIYPNLFGATNWYSPSYSPRTQLFYIPSWQESNMNMAKMPVQFSPGQRYTGGAPRASNPAAPASWQHSGGRLILRSGAGHRSADRASGSGNSR